MRTASGVTERGPLGSPPTLALSHRQPPSPLTTDQHQAFRVPVSEADADAMLASAESRATYVPLAVKQELVADLSRFLGAMSRVWTTGRRRRLETLLIDAGRIAVAPVLQTVIATPREEVIDDAVAVLAGIAERLEDAATAFADALTRAQIGGPMVAPIVREVLLRALVRGQSERTRSEKLRVAFTSARVDPSPAVRDAAVQALSTIGRQDGAAIVRVLLEKLKVAERDAGVTESIDDALDALRDS
jgi:hypothetical protein